MGRRSGSISPENQSLPLTAHLENLNQAPITTLAIAIAIVIAIGLLSFCCLTFVATHQFQQPRHRYRYRNRYRVLLLLYPLRRVLRRHDRIRHVVDLAPGVLRQRLARNERALG